MCRAQADHDGECVPNEIFVAAGLLADPPD